MASWMVDVLNVLTGNLDRPGGAMFSHAAHEQPRAPRGFQLGRCQSRVKGLPEVRGELPVSTMADEILEPGPGQIRALVTIAGNPILSTPCSDRLDAALSGLEFMVSVDIYLNETSRHADVILPRRLPLRRALRLRLQSARRAQHRQFTHLPCSRCPMTLLTSGRCCSGSGLRCPGRVGTRPRHPGRWCFRVDDRLGRWKSAVVDPRRDPEEIFAATTGGGPQRLSSTSWSGPAPMETGMGPIRRG